MPIQNALQTLIDTYIRQNGNQEITGEILNGVLTQFCNALDAPYIGPDGYWYIYDVDTAGYVRSDVQAQGPQGEPGVATVTASVDNATGTPSVDVTMVGTALDLAFHNLKGDTGATGATGPQGSPGITAATASVDANTGTPAVAASINGTTLDLAFSNLKGETGQTGATGPQGSTGPQGVSVTSVQQTTTSSADGGTNIITVTLSNGNTSTFEVKNGSKGSTGATGATGPTGPTGPAGVTSASASVDATTGTPAVTATLNNGNLDLAFLHLKGETGATGATGPTGPAGVTSVTASVDANVGTPSVTPTLLNGNLDLAFSNMKGATGATGSPGITAATASVDANIGTPAVTATITGTTLDLAFSNLKGQTGATGATGPQGPQGDYPLDAIRTTMDASLESNILYELGVLSGSVTFALATPQDATVPNLWTIAFSTGASAPTITWPGAVTAWAGDLDENNQPLIEANSSYEVSILAGRGIFRKFV